jgi:hypothetical protein
MDHNMSGQQRPIRHDVLIANDAVMSHVAGAHDQVIVAYNLQ